MINQWLVIVAGIAAAVGVGTLVVAAMARTSRRNLIALRWGRSALILAGVLVFLGYFADGDLMNLAGGLMLVLFGAGVTAIRRRPDAAR